MNEYTYVAAQQMKKKRKKLTTKIHKRAQTSVKCQRLFYGSMCNIEDT